MGVDFILQITTDPRKARWGMHTCVFWPCFLCIHPNVPGSTAFHEYQLYGVCQRPLAICHNVCPWPQWCFLFFIFLLLFVNFSCHSYLFSLSGCCLASLQSLGEVGFLPAVSMCGSLLYLSALSAEAEMCWSLFSAPQWNSRSLCY